MKKIFYLFIITLLCAGCADKMSAPEHTDSSHFDTEDYVTSSTDGMMVLGEKLNNPYSLANMQAAYDELCSTKSVVSNDLEATDLYVRFLPKDSTDIAFLQSLDLELFDFPLDYDIEQYGDYYHDPFIPETEITWQYTKVKPDFEFPDMQYEILDECYIPEEDESLTKSSPYSGFAEELEIMAINLADLPAEYSVVETKASVKKYPAGYVKDDNGKSYEPVKGVKVRCHYFLKWKSDYTDDNGYYKVSKKFSCNPHYSVILENQKDFVVWGNWGFVSPANHHIGRKSTSGHDINVGQTSQAWKWLVINNDAYEYYMMCERDGIKKPPTDFKIWCWGDVDVSSAPMLHHLWGLNVTAFILPFVSILAGPAYVAVSTLSWFLMAALPDVTIGTKGCDYYQIYNVVQHELTHASHFSNAGEALWGRYINYIVTHGCYGDGTAETKGKDICELGESWANAFERYSSYSKFGIDNKSGRSHWFNSTIDNLFDLMFNKVLTPKEIYDCLDKEVKSMSDLKEKMLENYESRSSLIEKYM